MPTTNTDLSIMGATIYVYPQIPEFSGKSSNGTEIFRKFCFQIACRSSSLSSKQNSWKGKQIVSGKRYILLTFVR